MSRFVTFGRREVVVHLMYVMLVAVDKVKRGKRGSGGGTRREEKDEVKDRARM